MKFNELTVGDVNYLKDLSNHSKTSTFLDILIEKYKISKRKAERWKRQLGLNRNYGGKIRTKVNSIIVIDPTVIRTETKSPARVLLYDIETAPLKSFVWGTWQQNIGHNMGMLEQDWFILTWSAKWLFEDTVYSDRLTADEVFQENDKRVVQSLWEMLEEADIVIAHNGKKFDNKRVNTRFLKNNIPQPMPYQVIDTLEIARKNFNISSNKLDYIGQFFGIGRKVSHQGFELWKRCMNGEEEALKEMEAYNIGDVTLLEDVYLKLRPYMKPHPNMGLYITEDVECCPSCGGKELEQGGSYATSLNTYDAFRCNNCGSLGRKRKSNIPSGSKKNLSVPVAR